MKIFINEEIRYEPWGGGAHVVTSLIEYLKEKGFTIASKLEKNIDLIIIWSNSHVRYKARTKPLFKYKKKNPNTKILHRINVSDISKNTTNVNELVFKSNSIADETIFISKWLANYYIQDGFKRSYHVIYNGCNSNFFYPKNDKELEEPVNLVTHHWSTNWMKGFDIYMELDKILNKRRDITFTYIGRYYDNYTPENTHIIPPLYGKDLGDELRNFDIYLTASRYEASGLHHVEGARCGLPVLYHEEGGGINEVCKEHGIEYNDIHSLLEAIEEMKDKYNYYRNKINYDFLSNKRCNESYYKVIVEMLE